MTWMQTSALSGAFDIQPDQIGRGLGDADALYFCEDGGSDSEIHGRDATGKFFTVVQNNGIGDENTDLAFSPDGSQVFAFWREDGSPFDAVVADAKYH